MRAEPPIISLAEAFVVSTVLPSKTVALLHTPALSTQKFPSTVDTPM
jgi:hypothetical protein